MSPRHDFTIERVADTRLALYYRCSFGKDGREMVTVRVGKENVYACLGCVTICCEHCRAVRAFAENEAARTARGLAA